MRQMRPFVMTAVLAVILVVGALSAHAQVIMSNPPDDFVLILTFDEGKGDKLIDHSKYGHDLDLMAGQAKWVNGKYGGGMEFDGATAFEVAKTDVLASFVDQITVGAWFKPSQMNSWTNLVEMDGDGQGNQAWKTGFRDREMVFTTYWVKDHFGGTLLELDTWQHIAYTYDGKTAKFYLNGKLDSETPGSGVFDTSAAGVIALDIGWRRSSGSSFLNGVVDDLWVSQKVKSEKEIADMMAGIVLSVDPAGKATTTWGALKTR